MSKMELEKKSTRRISFESCKGETCTARILEGYLSDEKTGEPIDIFQSFLDYDHVLFLFTYADGSHKSVAIPLFTFKQQYKSLSAKVSYRICPGSFNGLKADSNQCDQDRR